MFARSLCSPESSLAPATGEEAERYEASAASGESRPKKKAPSCCNGRGALPVIRINRLLGRKRQSHKRSSVRIENARLHLTNLLYKPPPPNHRSTLTVYGNPRNRNAIHQTNHHEGRLYDV